MTTTLDPIKVSLELDLSTLKEQLRELEAPTAEEIADAKLEFIRRVKKWVPETSETDILEELENYKRIRDRNNLRRTVKYVLEEEIT